MDGLLEPKEGSVANSLDLEITVVDVTCPGPSDDRVLIHLSEAPLPMAADIWERRFKQSFEAGVPPVSTEITDSVIRLQATPQEVLNFNLVARVRKAVTAANAEWNNHLLEQQQRDLERQRADEERQRDVEDLLDQIKREQLGDQPTI